MQKSARAQWGPVKEIPIKADDGPWSWPLDVDRYDRAGELGIAEADMLTRYAEEYRFYRYGRTMDFGPVLDRLVQPINDALDYVALIAIWRNVSELFGVPLSPDGRRGRTSVPSREPRVTRTIS